MENKDKFANLYDIDIERAVLKTIFTNDEAFSMVDYFLFPNDFHYKAHSDIFSAILECVRHDEPIDFAFVKKRLGNRYNETALSDIAATTAIVDIEKYANEIKEKAIKRALIKISDKIPKEVNEPKPTSEMIDGISAELYSLIDNNKNGTMKEMPQILREFSNLLKKQKESLDKDLVGLDTGFRMLNEYTKGFKPGELIIIAARPGMGKTAFALNVIMKTLNMNKGVAFFSLEMPSDQLMMRIFSSLTSLPISDLMTGKLEDEQLERLGDAMNEMETKNLFVYDSGYVNINKVKTELRKLKTSGKDVDLCVIDYIGLMTSSGNYNERHLQIAEISRGLKLLARELNIPIIALSQLNRGLEARANKRPMASDLRESGAIEQDADIILFVYRGDVYAQQAEDERREAFEKSGRDMSEYKPVFQKNVNNEKAEIIIGKNRNGALATVKVTFQERFTRFVDGYDEKVYDDEPVASSEFGNMEQN